MVDDIISGEISELPIPEHRRAIDELVRTQRGSAKLATLFLLFYWLEDPEWNRKDIPVGTRGKHGDKRIAEELTKRSITLHDNVTAFGENLGWKGNVREFDLSKDKRFKVFSDLGPLSPEEVKRVSYYYAGLFSASQSIIAPLPSISGNILTFARAKQLLLDLAAIQSEGHIQQFLVAALLFCHRQKHGYDIRTHHPHASDKFDSSAGDIEEYYSGQLTRAYEVTVRDDWRNRISNFKSKMDKFNLQKYVIIASNISNTPEWNEPAQLLIKLEPYGRDIAVIDIIEFLNVFAAELSATELRAAINKTYEYLSNIKLCGKNNVIESYREVVDKWLDNISG